jgi:hypothetical protein
MTGIVKDGSYESFIYLPLNFIILTGFIIN